MFSKSFKVVAPKRIEIYLENLSAGEGDAVVRIENAAVCKADIRYYLGQREERVLNRKYPMSLLHEAAGTVLKDRSGTFRAGERVILVPNMEPRCHKEQCSLRVCEKPELGTNYCPSALFASSNCDGFSKDVLSHPAGNIVPLPSGVDFRTGVFSELISVACSAVRRSRLSGGETVMVWGDGILGYILCCVLHQTHAGRLICIGRHREKLDKIPADECFLSEDPAGGRESCDAAFECVGGRNSEEAENQMIDTVVPGGKMVLAGVPAGNPGLNVRKVMEKGLEIYGVTRSNTEDFRTAVNLLELPDFNRKISGLVLDEIEVRSIRDYYRVFEREIENRALGKHIMKFNF